MYIFPYISISIHSFYFYLHHSGLFILALFEVLSNKALVNSKVSSSKILLIFLVLYPKWVAEIFLNTLYCFNNMLLLIQVSPQRKDLYSRSISNITAYDAFPHYLEEDSNAHLKHLVYAFEMFSSLFLLGNT